MTTATDNKLRTVYRVLKNHQEAIERDYDQILFFLTKFFGRDERTIKKYEQMLQNIGMLVFDKRKRIFVLNPDWLKRELDLENVLEDYDVRRDKESRKKRSSDQ